ncbi:uncharacterized protein LOC144643321 [Oculina patagonica]
MDNHVFNCAFTKDVDVNLECSICKNIMIKPTTLSCGHSGCNGCYTRLLAHELQNGNPHAKCPECRVRTFSMADLGINFTLHKMTSSLEVKCIQGECDWIGTLSEAENHNRHCPRRPKVDCPLGCGEKLLWCHVTLHLGMCPEKVITCSVKGCNLVFKRLMEETHIITCALSHAVLYEGEIYRLRNMIHSRQQNAVLEKGNLQEDKVHTFTWKVDQGDATVASSPYSAGNARWRGVRAGDKIFLQLDSAVNPQTIKASIILMPGGKSEKCVTLPVCTVKEGEMIGNISTAPNCKTSQTTARGISVKFIIISFVHK